MKHAYLSRYYLIMGKLNLLNNFEIIIDMVERSHYREKQNNCIF